MAKTIVAIVVVRVILTVLSVKASVKWIVMNVMVVVKLTRKNVKIVMGKAKKIVVLVMEIVVVGVASRWQRRAANVTRVLRGRWRHQAGDNIKRARTRPSSGSVS